MSAVQKMKEQMKSTAADTSEIDGVDNTLIPLKLQSRNGSVKVQVPLHVLASSDPDDLISDLSDAVDMCVRLGYPVDAWQPSNNNYNGGGNRYRNNNYNNRYGNR